MELSQGAKAFPERLAGKANADWPTTQQTTAGMAVHVTVNM